jgi:uncharacterized membrane protein
MAPTGMQRHSHARAIAVLVMGYLAGLIAYPNLPGPFLDNALFARVMVAFTLPTTALVIYALFRSLWRHDRIRSGNGAFEATYAAIVFRCLLFVTGLHALVMIVLVGQNIDRQLAMRAVVVMLGLTFVAVGNLLPRTRPNVAVGVRTRLTLANAQLWTQVHRVGGYVTVFWGIVIAIAAMTLSGEVLGAAIGSSGIAAVGILFVSYLRHARA